MFCCGARGEVRLRVGFGAKEGEVKAFNRLTCFPVLLSWCVTSEPPIQILSELYQMTNLLNYEKGNGGQQRWKKLPMVTRL